MSTTKARMSPARQKLVERVLAVAAVAAVLVAFGAWFAMGRSAGADEASANGGAAGDGEYSTSLGGDAEGGGTGSDADGSSEGADDGSADGADGDASASDGGGSSGTSGDGSSGTSGNGSSGNGSSANGSSGTTGTTGTNGSPATPSRTPPPAGPATAFLAALEASGMAPPADDEVRLAFGQDVCTELGYGAPRADVVRAVTFAGASDAEAENLVGLAIRHLCPQHA